jgi:hypothetical protein
MGMREGFGLGCGFQIGRAVAGLLCFVVVVGAIVLFGKLSEQHGPPDTKPNETKRADENVGQPPSTPPAPAAGQIVIRSTQPVQVEAFIEVDGERAVNWPTGESLVRVPVKPGERRVVYRSKASGKYYKNEFGAVGVQPGGEAQLTLRGVIPDSTGHW